MVMVALLLAEQLCVLLPCSVLSMVSSGFVSFGVALFFLKERGSMRP